MAIYKIINSLLAVSAASDAHYTSEQSHNLSGFADYDDAVPNANALDRGARALIHPAIGAVVGGVASGVAAVAADKGIEHLEEKENRDKLESIVKETLDTIDGGLSTSIVSAVSAGFEAILGNGKSLRKPQNV